MKSIINGKIYYNQQFSNNQILVFDEEIKGIYTKEDYLILKNELNIKGEVIEELDGEGNFIVPGFIDVHIHGYKGVDVMDGRVESIQTLRKSVVENGVTAFLPTTMTMDMKKIETALETVKTVIELNEIEDEDGAMILGVHLEGPFINNQFKGAQPGEHIIKGNIEWLTKYSDLIKVVTIAPEIEGNLDLIKALGHKINFSIGHSGASFEEAMEAYNCGAKSATHLFNAMTGMHHRKPGVVGAVMSCDCYTELIGDKFHVHPGLYPFLLKTKGYDKLLLITDCMRAGGLKEGVYDLGGQEVVMKDNQCLLSDGTIAGSVLKLNEGLKNFYDNVEEDLGKVIPLVTSNQAKYLKLDKFMGTLDKDKIANITWLNKDIQVIKTIVKGSIIYES